MQIYANLHIMALYKCKQHIFWQANIKKRKLQKLFLYKVFQQKNDSFTIPVTIS